MTRRLLKYLLLVAILVFVGYKSVYIKKLSEVKSASAAEFDALSFSKDLWEKKFPGRVDSAVSLDTFITAVRSNPVPAFEKHSNMLGIGNARFTMVKASGVIEKISDDDITIKCLVDGSATRINLATEYVYGNAVRDASRLVNISDFVNTMDLNRISEELNRIVKRDIIASFRSAAKVADSVSFTGVLELNKEHVKLDELNIIPVRLQILHH